MFDAIEIPFGSTMLYNVITPNHETSLEEIEYAIGEMCNVVNRKYGDAKGGFIGGQVFRFTGHISPEGSSFSNKKSDDHIAIVTYWKSLGQHEKSHADDIFKDKFNAISKFCSETHEIGYEMMWQGASAITN